MIFFGMSAISTTQYRASRLLLQPEMFSHEICGGARICYTETQSHTITIRCVLEQQIGREIQGFSLLETSKVRQSQWGASQDFRCKTTISGGAEPWRYRVVGLTNLTVRSRLFQGEKETEKQIQRWFYRPKRWLCLRPIQSLCNTYWGRFDWLVLVKVLYTRLGWTYSSESKAWTPEVMSFSLRSAGARFRLH